MPQLPQRDESPKHVFNPESTDFNCSYAIDDKPPEVYTVRAMESATFPAFLANHVAKHLSQYIVLKRGVKTNYDDEFRQVWDNEVMRLNDEV